MNIPLKRPQYDRIWAQYREFALTSRKMKASWEFWQRLFLWVAVIGTFLAAAGSQAAISSDFTRGLGCCGALLLAIGAFLSREIFSSSREILWTKARAIAEALKSECFLYAACVSPYEGSDAEAALRKNADERIGTIDSLFPGGLEGSDDKKPPSIPLNLDGYIEARINDQEKYYTSAAKKAYLLFKKWRVIQIVLGAFVVALGVVAGINQPYADRVNAMVVLTSAIIGFAASYAAMGRYEYLSKSYGALRSRMRNLAAEGKACTDTATFIHKCETEISAEHQSWISEWQKKPMAAAPHTN